MYRKTGNKTAISGTDSMAGKGVESRSLSPLARRERVGSFDSGFTMVEILIVVVILSIAAMLAVPMMGSAEDMQGRAAADMVSADIEYARSLAITTGRNHSVAFDAATDSYRIEDESGSVVRHPVKKGFDYIVDFRKEPRLGMVGIAEASFGLGTVVTFDYLGSCVDGGFVRLQAGVLNMKVNVEPVTGFISIKEL